MRNGFLRNRDFISRISNYEIAVGIILGLAMAFSFYALFSVISEAFRMLYYALRDDLCILSEEEFGFFNLFYAYLSLILGQSTTLLFWLDRARMGSRRMSLNRISIIHDQRFYNWYFLSWFSKVAISYGIIFVQIVGCKSGFIHFFSAYKYLFILFVVVMFLQTWNTISKVFKKRALRWMGVSAILISILAFGLSKIDIANYQQTNEKIISHNITLQYPLQLPEMEFSQMPDKYSLLREVYVFKGLYKGKNMPFIVIDNEKFPIDSISSKLKEMRNAKGELDRNFLTFLFYIDRGMRMDFVSQLKSKLNIRDRCHFAVKPIGFGSQRTYVKYLSRFLLVGFQDSFVRKKQKFLEEAIKIEANNDSTYWLQDSIVLIDDFEDKLIELIRGKKKYVLWHISTDDETFESYLRRQEHAYKAIIKMREVEAYHQYGEGLDQLLPQERRVIKRKYPFSWVEYTHEFE